MGACLAGGVQGGMRGLHGREGACVRGACVAEETATEAGGTQPIGMHSCEQDKSNLSKQTHSEM